MTHHQDLPGAEKAVRELLESLGVDLGGSHLADTPRRVAEALAEMITPIPFELTTFPNEEGYDELVIDRAIPFHSLCAHHLLPFFGVAHVAYLPAGRICGLSKLARVVEHFSRGLQVQEILTQQIADHLQSELQPKGVGVVMEAQHTCLTLRGARATGTMTVTSALHGAIRNDPRTRQEFLTLIGGVSRA